MDEKFFTVPSDFQKQTIDTYSLLNQNYYDSQITETYGNISINNIFGSGRAHKNSIIRRMR